MKKRIISMLIAVATVFATVSFIEPVAEGLNFTDIVFPEMSVNGGAPVRGVDISSIVAIENAGVVFRDDDGNPRDIFATLRENGVNYIRARIWNEPTHSQTGLTYGGGNNDVTVAAEIGRRAAEHGMKLLVNFHYSDFWADPGKQTPPKAWAGFTAAQLETAVYEFTRDSLRTIAEAGADIGMVQVGNETNYFMCGLRGMDNLARLMSAGSRAVREFDPDVLVAVHFTDPTLGNGQTMIWYAQELNRLRLDYDVFMTSYYSFWHGTIENLANVLNTIATRFGKYVAVGEMAHPYTDAAGDGFGHEVTSRSTHAELRYPVSPQGQVDMLTDVYRLLANVPNGLGIGAFYWEPAWLGVMGLTHQQRTNLWTTHGSGWATAAAGEFDAEARQYGVGGSSYQNQALFDFRGNPLPSLAFYRHVTAVNEPVEPPEPPEPPEPVVRVEREQLVEDGVSWRISRLFVGDEFEEERRGAKRDSDGEFLSPTAEYRRISPTEAREIMLNQPHVLLDVRRQDEFDERHISGAILLPYDEIDTRADADLPDRHALILIYCRSGRRSEIAARALLALGYTNVLDFGGILDWDY